MRKGLIRPLIIFFEIMLRMILFTKTPISQDVLPLSPMYCSTFAYHLYSIAISSLSFWELFIFEGWGGRSVFHLTFWCICLLFYLFSWRDKRKMFYEAFFFSKLSKNLKQTLQMLQIMLLVFLFRIIEMIL